MNLGIILPPKSKSAKPESMLSRFLTTSLFGIPLIETEKVELLENINLIICNIPTAYGNAMPGKSFLKRLKHKLDRIFLEEGVLSVLEHPAVHNLYGSYKAKYDPYLTEIAVNRLPELLKSVREGANPDNMEIALTGSSRNLEYAITRLITSVKCINILVPEGFEEPEEAESAFEETGIPVHITNDPEVLLRTTLWIRFPNDHESFDALPGTYKGKIIDLGALKVIDTRTKRIYNICLELPGSYIKKIGCIPDEFGLSRLPGFITAYCANAWDRSAAEVSMRLGMRLSLKP